MLLKSFIQSFFRLDIKKITFLHLKSIHSISENNSRWDIQVTGTEQGKAELITFNLSSDLG